MGVQGREEQENSIEEEIERRVRAALEQEYQQREALQEEQSRVRAASEQEQWDQDQWHAWHGSDE